MYSCNFLNFILLCYDCLVWWWHRGCKTLQVFPKWWHISEFCCMLAQLWIDYVLKVLNISFISMYSSPGWKIQKMVKKSWLSVKKMWIWCEKYQKKFGLNWRFPWRAPAKTCSLGFGSVICPLHVICKAICRPKKFHPVCLTFGVTDDH